MSGIIFQTAGIKDRPENISMKPISRHPFFTLLIVLSILSSSLSFAQEKSSAGFNKAKGHWTFLGGYGVTHKGFGDTRTRVESVDFILQYGYFLTGEAGNSWYRGRHEILIELPVYTVFHPETAIMTGINFLACWNFTSAEKTIPYVFAGGGPVYTNLDIPGLGSKLNGNYQAGLGFHYFTDSNHSFDFNYRLHHISNAGTAEPNEPLNSSKFLLGISFIM